MSPISLVLRGPGRSLDGSRESVGKLKSLAVHFRSYS